MKAFPYLFALLAGAALALQSIVNSQARARLGTHPLQATLVNFGTGTIVLTVTCAAAALLWPRALGWPSWNTIAQAPLWVWTGGLLGILFVTSSVVLTQPLGAALFFVLVIAGQLAGSLVLDEFGLLGARVIPASPGRIAGVFLVFAGAMLVAYSTATPSQKPKTAADSPPAVGSEDRANH